MKKNYSLKERIKELKAFYDVSDILYSNHLSVEEIFYRIIPVLKQAWQYPEITGVRIAFGSISAETSGFESTPWMQSSKFEVMDEQGEVQISYFEKKKKAYEGPFLLEERRLIDSIAKMLGVYLARKINENKLETMLAKKIIMLKEIHHRVRNNLQIISSLLRLQSNSIDDLHSQELIRISENRVKAMSIIHEALYTNTDFKKINYELCFENLIKHLFSSYNMFNKGITYTIEARNLDFGIDHAIPCGMILNELVTNSIKHGFKGRNTGLIDICIKNASAGYLALVYRDNGNGNLSEMNPNMSTTLGFQLISSLAQQIDGEAAFKNLSNGMEFIMKFPYYGSTITQKKQLLNIL